MKVLRKETSVNRLDAKAIDGWWRGWGGVGWGEERVGEKKIASGG